MYAFPIQNYIFFFWLQQQILIAVSENLFLITYCVFSTIYENNPIYQIMQLLEQCFIYKTIKFYTGYDDVGTVVIRYKYVKDITLTMKANGTVDSWHIDIDNLFKLYSNGKMSAQVSWLAWSNILTKRKTPNFPGYFHTLTHLLLILIS